MTTMLNHISSVGRTVRFSGLNWSDEANKSRRGYQSRLNRKLNRRIRKEQGAMLKEPLEKLEAFLQFLISSPQSQCASNARSMDVLPFLWKRVETKVLGGQLADDGDIEKVRWLASNFELWTNDDVLRKLVAVWMLEAEAKGFYVRIPEAPSELPPSSPIVPQLPGVSSTVFSPFKSPAGCLSSPSTSSDVSTNFGARLSSNDQEIPLVSFLSFDEDDLETVGDSLQWQLDETQAKSHRLGWARFGWDPAERTISHLVGSIQEVQLVGRAHAGFCEKAIRSLHQALGGPTGIQTQFLRSSLGNERIPDGATARESVSRAAAIRHARVG